ncbi:acyl-CoA dehydrogenase domain-containing protein [Solidesulfovibrio carbinoliphilus subsp. oakridgensis]|uniref:Acyl-CoA dehydrogenase domain-containing protein n=1 Tax=Solidesulfovibrio carbinoliphilus subsp. oakridgensis TaxID=694327 RepID=G7QB02_9BACT|nr:acyl-CoA dehydrogenase family protein [Solidesulfovibrio carbinoliphilus]EHJ48343.1 acyl-CoA dehydrogenase domain-containing protein [Solidesulfovibrio carbinoliphilus subsp. oakridgensis]
MEILRTLPGDDVRQIMWRFADRFDLQMAVQSARSVARGLVARLVADGVRHSHEWTPEKDQLLQAFDDAGITSVFLDPHQGGYIEGPKNMALALVAFELSWVDAGAATCSLASNLALSPIHERGTTEQRDHYMSLCAPAPGKAPWRGAFGLTEPLPYVGVDTGVLCGKVRVDSWEDGQEPMLHIDKRGRFITGMDFANFATVAVDTADPRIKTSCMVILEETDPGLFDRGAPTLKMVHQLSSTRDPVFNMKVPASRIIGGYTVKDGCIVPNYSHSEIIAAVFHRTRVPVALMTTAKLLSAVEPVIRYQRTRFRGGDACADGTPKFELGLQQKQDAPIRLAELWAAGEAGASLGFATARLFDHLDPTEKAKEHALAAAGVTGMRAQLTALKKVQPQAVEYVNLLFAPEETRDAARFAALDADPVVKYQALEAEAGVLCPACKLWNTGYGATVMREAVAMMGGYGITEDCPGFLFHKWNDSQLEATYEGPECVQRRQLSITMASDIFLAYCDNYVAEMDRVAATNPETGAASVAAGFRVWRAAFDFLAAGKDADGKKLYHSTRQAVTFPLADALCPLLASRLLILDTLELAAKGPENPVVAEGLPGYVAFFSDLAKIQAAKAATEAARACAGLVHGYAPAGADLAAFAGLRQAVDASLAGLGAARERAGAAISQVMIPEALDYPM